VNKQRSAILLIAGSICRDSKTSLGEGERPVLLRCLAVRIQEFPKGYAEQGVWGMEVPQLGPGAESRWGSSPPEATDIVLNSQLTTSENFNTKTYTTLQNRTNLAQEIKLVWSSQSELINDFDRFDWRRLRMYVD